MKFRRGLWLLVVMMALTFTSAFVPDATPVRAASCYGHTCNGKDPISQGCHYDAVTKTQAPIWYGYAISWQGGVVELRYSAACNARWARVTSYVGVAHIMGHLTTGSYPIPNTWFNVPESLGESDYYGNMYGAPIKAQGSIYIDGQFRTATTGTW